MSRSHARAWRVRHARRSPHLVVRFAAALTYLTLVTVATSPAVLLALLALLALATASTRAPLRTLYVPLLMVLALEEVVLAQSAPALNVTRVFLLIHAVPFASGALAPLTPMLMSLATVAIPAWVVAAALSIAKLACLALIIGAFAALTRPSELLNVFSAAGNRLPGTRSLIYLLSTTLAVLPSVRLDLRRSIDVAILRTGGRAQLALPRTWGAILTDVLVRAILRSQRMADAVVERGYHLATGLIPLPRQRLRLLDVLAGVVLIAPGAACFGVFR